MPLRIFPGSQLITLAAILASATPVMAGWIPAPVSAKYAGDTVAAATPVRETREPGLPAEGYRIRLTPAAHGQAARITLAYADEAGRRYGHASLTRLRDSTTGALPAGEILDYPRFRHRGLMLDESRHFYGKAFVKRLLTLLAEHRLNTFHWHLTDGPGWRLEIPAYPRLTDVGAWRVDKTAKPWDWRATEIHADGRHPGDYGGFYTAADIADVLAHAKSLGITVIPEIECPGHAYAALLAYPETACNPAGVAVDGLRGHDVFCAASPATLALLKGVLDRTCELFPDAPYIHLGGDEVSPVAWQNCPRCTALKEKLGLPSHDALRGALLHQLAAHLAAHGRKVMVWDEAADLPLPPGTALTVWRTGHAAATARASGRPRILCPISHLYFDYGQTPAGLGEPPSAGPGLTLAKVYGYEPLAPGETPATVLGVQANLWTEHVPTAAHAERLLLPRLAALAELAWTPPAGRDFADFSRRLPAHLTRLRHMGYQVFAPAPVAAAPPSPVPPAAAGAPKTGGTGL